MVRVKICGLMNKEDAKLVNEYRADFAGFVLFFPKSRRCLTIPEAREIMSCLDASIKKVAVTVSPTQEQVEEMEKAGFDFLQVHGQLSENVLEKAKLPILRAVNISGEDALVSLEKSGKIAGYVLDGKDPGGGKAFDWKMMKPQIETLFYENGKRTEKLFVLAGGLYPENVRKALEICRPDIVDVSSSVELAGEGKSRGKDREKVERFFHAVREAEEKSASKEK